MRKVVHLQFHKWTKVSMKKYMTRKTFALTNQKHPYCQSMIQTMHLKRTNQWLNIEPSTEKTYRIFLKDWINQWEKRASPKYAINLFPTEQKFPKLPVLWALQLKINNQNQLYILLKLIRSFKRCILHLQQMKSLTKS